MSLYKKTLFILISGKAGVGKTTTQITLNSMIKESGEFKTYCDSFAMGVKQTAYSIGWDGYKDARGRNLLQKIGGLGREYDKDVWVGRLFRRYVESTYAILPADVVIVDDWRFPNELDYVKRQAEATGMLEPITIRIEAPDREILKGTPEYDELSETSLPSALGECLEYNKNYYNYTIQNNGTMEELINKVSKVYENLKNLREIIHD